MNRLVDVDGPICSKKLRYISGDLVKVGSVVKVAAFNIGLKCRGKSWFVFIVRPLEDFIKFEVALE